MPFIKSLIRGIFYASYLLASIEKDRQYRNVPRVQEALSLN